MLRKRERGHETYKSAHSNSDTKYSLAEIACARLGSCAVVVASPSHAAVGATARPPIALRPVLEETTVLAAVLGLKLAFQVLALVEEAVSPACLLLLRAPGHELQSAEVLGAVATKAVAVVPELTPSALFFVRLPVFDLTLLT